MMDSILKQRLLTHEACESLERPGDAALGVHLDEHVAGRVDVHLREADRNTATFMIPWNV
jgi:hypothetical protein